LHDLYFSGLRRDVLREKREKKRGHRKNR
jgi:hypothetical protein